MLQCTGGGSLCQAEGKMDNQTEDKPPSSTSGCSILGVIGAIVFTGLAALFLESYRTVDVDMFIGYCAPFIGYVIFMIFGELVKK